MEEFAGGVKILHDVPSSTGNPQRKTYMFVLKFVNGKGMTCSRTMSYVLAQGVYPKEYVGDMVHIFMP